MENFKSSLRVLDPRLARESQVVDIINEGPSSVTYQSVVCPDPTSLQPSFVIQPPSVLSGVNRNMRLRVKGTLTVTGTNLDGFTLTTNRVALRQFALQSIMQNLQVQLNDATVSLGSLGLYVAGLAQVSNTSASMASAGSTFPSRPDMFTDYQDEVGLPGGLFSSEGDGPYGDAVVSGRCAEITSITLVGTTQLNIGFDVAESLIISPFNYSERENKALYGIQTMTISMAYANVHRMLSLAPGAGVGGAATISGVTLAPTSQALECSYVTPNDASLIQRPIGHVYDYCGVQQYTTSVGGTFAPGATISASSNSIEFPVIPSKLICYLTYSQTDLADPTRSLADVCLPIKNASVTFGTRAGLLSGASQVNLWEVSRRAGLRAKYSVFAGKQAVTSVAGAAQRNYSGAPLIIDTAADLSLPSGDQPVVPGMNYRIQFQIQATFENNLLTNIVNPRLVVLALTSGYITCKDGMSVVALGGVSLEAARNAPVASLTLAENITQLRQTDGIAGGGGAMVGGFSLGDLWDKVKGPLQSIAPVVAPLALGAIPGVGPMLAAASVPLMASALGSGKGGAMVGGTSIGGAPAGGRARSKLLGGRLMAREQYN